MTYLSQCYRSTLQSDCTLHAKGQYENMRNSIFSHFSRFQLSTSFGLQTFSPYHYREHIYTGTTNLTTNLTTNRFHRYTKSGMDANTICPSIISLSLTPRALMANTFTHLITFGVCSSSYCLKAHTNFMLGLGFNNALQEQLFLSHLAYITNRA